MNAVEHIYQAWDEALGVKDLDAALALYRPDALLESPLVCHLLGTDQGIVRGHGELRPFVEQVFARQPPERRRFRVGYRTDGTRLTSEYPREPGRRPDGPGRVMEIRDGLIQCHRVYWGWYAVGMLRGERHP